MADYAASLRDHVPRTCRSVGIGPLPAGLRAEAAVGGRGVSVSVLAEGVRDSSPAADWSTIARRFQISSVRTTLPAMAPYRPRLFRKGMSLEGNSIRRIVDKHGSLRGNSAALDEIESVPCSQPI